MKLFCLKGVGKRETMVLEYLLAIWETIGIMPRRNEIAEKGGKDNGLQNCYK